MYSRVTYSLYCTNSRSACSTTYPRRLAMSVAKYFGLDEATPREMEHGLTRNEIDRAASAFEHEDLKEGFRKDN
jgi:hypothetical protein